MTSIFTPPGVVTHAWPGRDPGSTFNPQLPCFDQATNPFQSVVNAWRSVTRNPTWSTNEPALPSGASILFPGGGSLIRMRIPGNKIGVFPDKLKPSLPPKASHANVSFCRSGGYKCKWPQASPASLTGANCAHAPVCHRTTRTRIDSRFFIKSPPRLSQDWLECLIASNPGLLPTLRKFYWVTSI